MAPTTAPNVFWTASPTFLAIRVPPSSSKAASNNSGTRKDAIYNNKKKMAPCPVMKRFCTGRDLPVVEAGVTDPHGGQAPAPLWDRPRLGGAGIAEALPAGAAVVLGVVGLELFATFVASLKDAHPSLETPTP